MGRVGSVVVVVDPPGLGEDLSLEEAVELGAVQELVAHPAVEVPARAWQCISAGKGAKGHRFYDWAFARLDGDADHSGQHWLLVRRNRKTKELAFYRCWMPRPVPMATLVQVASRRWSIEERIQTGKGLVGLDQHQVRRWRSWYRWATLALPAHAFLVVAALTDSARRPPPPGLVGLTCNELQHLFAALVAAPAGDLAHRLRWSLRLGADVAIAASAAGDRSHR